MTESMTRLETESDLQYLLRLCLLKKENVTDLAYHDIFDLVFGRSFSPDESRKRYYGMDMLISLLPVDIKTIPVYMLPEEEKTMLRDERNALKLEQRKMCRSKRFFDLMEESVPKVDSLKLPTVKLVDRPNSDCALVVQLSDWHLGLKVDNVWNKYDSEIFNKRMNIFLSELVELFEIYKPSETHILVQGDIISGNIRNTIRLQNQENLIEQMILASEKICESALFIQNMSKSPVQLHFVAGNHERVTAKKDDNLNAENYIKLTSYFCMLRLSNRRPIVHIENKYGVDMASFDIMGMKAVAVHGDKDSFGNVVNNVSAMTKYVPDIIFTAHHHHTHYEDLQKCRVISNGSIVGMDDYSEKLRLHAYPSQNAVIVKRNKQVIPFPILVEE